MFIDLIRELDQVDEVARFRISSIEPNLLTDEVIAFVAESRRFMPHFHVPLQSGTDKQLRAMRRRYTRDLYAARVAHIKRAMPHACIGCDVIVGFPGETEADFLETYSFIQDLDVSYLHVFTYSERANTPAAEMLETVPVDERRHRNQALRGLSEMKRRHFYQTQLGTHRPVLLEAHREAGKRSGFTDNYVKVDAPESAGEINAVRNILLQTLTADGEAVFVKV
jgi:threonylcarbamoyladenosine tRNA methylthiotransferase MtaB